MGDNLVKGAFRVALPIKSARRDFVTRSDGTIDTEMWLHVEASGPERDSHGDRMSERALGKMVEYVERGYDGNPIPFLDGHHRDLLASHLGDIYSPGLNEKKHFCFDVKVKGRNPFGTELFEDVLAGKKHGASIAGIVHEAEIEKYDDEGDFGRLFHDVELVEVSRTSWPSWTPSFIELLGKSLKESPDDTNALVARRTEIVRAMHEMNGEGMPETTWIEKDGVMIERVTAPHGWDEKFKVSNAPWSSVKNRSKPCQFAIIKKKESGEFSKSNSGYPHHMPDCNTVNRGGVIGAAVRLVQAMKSHWPEIEIPPVVSMGTDLIGDEMGVYIENASRFSREELVYAANHIVKHYRRDLEMTPPENLVSVAKTETAETAEEAVELVKQLIEILVQKEYEMPEDKETPEVVEETPATEEIQVVEETTDVEELTAEMVEESATEEQETATETEVEIEPEITEIEIPETDVAGETEVESPVEISLADSLAAEVEDRMLARKFGVLVSAMSEMVATNVRKKDQTGAFRALDEFAALAKDTVKKAVARDVSMWTDDSVNAAMAEKIELAEGKLSKSRINTIEKAGEILVAEWLSLLKVIKNADVEDDAIVEKVAEAAAEKATAKTAAKKSDERLELERRMAAVETETKNQMDEVVKVLSESEPEEPQRMEDTEMPEVVREANQSYESVLAQFSASVEKGLNRR